MLGSAKQSKGCSFAGNYEYITDPAFVRLITVLRILFPQVCIVASTPEQTTQGDSICALGDTRTIAGIAALLAGFDEPSVPPIDQR